jgi:putative membrane protein
MDKLGTQLRTELWTRLCAVLSTVLLGCGGLAHGEAPAATQSDSEFLQRAMQNSLTEVELGKLAGHNARSTGINALGSRLARDHGRIGTMIGLISKDKGIKLPTALDADHRAVVERLSAKTGTEFDVAYTELMVAEQDRAIAMFMAATTSDDPDLAEFARRALPTLREQKRLALSFQKMTDSYGTEKVAVRD